MSLPIQSACNPEDPEEHVIWAFTGIAGPSAHAPLIVPPTVLKQWSQHLFDCGFRHHPELQKIKYVPPSRYTNWVEGASGQWVDMNEPLTPDQTAPDISGLSEAEQLVLLQELLQRFSPTEQD